MLEVRAELMLSSSEDGKDYFFLGGNNCDYEFMTMVMIPLTDTDFHLGRWLFSLARATQHRRCHARALRSGEDFDYREY